MWNILKRLTVIEKDLLIYFIGLNRRGRYTHELRYEKATQTKPDTSLQKDSRPVGSERKTIKPPLSREHLLYKLLDFYMH